MPSFAVPLVRPIPVPHYSRRPRCSWPLGPAMAQETRAEIIRQEQAEKQRAVAPPEPNRAEIIIDRLEDWGFSTGEPRGFYPWLGSVYPGGGFAAGVGVRKPFGDDGAVNVFGGYSINSFWRAEANVALPTFAQNRAGSRCGRYVDAPDVKYYGVGNDTHKDEQTHFGYTPAGGGRLDFEAGISRSPAASITSTSTTVQAPPDRPSRSASRPPTRQASSSTASATSTARRVRVRLAAAAGLLGHRAGCIASSSTTTASATTTLLVPIARGRSAAADSADARELGARASRARHGDRRRRHERRPVFHAAVTRRRQTLRGYPDFRFRDRHRLVMNAELRWTPARFLDMAVFYDTGKVASRRQDLDFDDLRGLVRHRHAVVGPKGYAFGVEVAHSREHAARLLVGAGGTF